MHIDTGIVKQEKDGPVEFQHPYFKHGQDELLENIKRKVSVSPLASSSNVPNQEEINNHNYCIGPNIRRCFLH